MQEKEPLFSTSRSRNPYGKLGSSPKLMWAAFATLAVAACAVGIWYPFGYTPNPINQPLVEVQKSRVSGFSMKAEAIFQKETKTNKAQVFARMFATGPMHNDEVIRMEGVFTLITPDGKQQSFGPESWTYSENLKSILPMAKVPPGSKVKVTGTIYVYHREDIKSEREMTADGTVRLYMNTGTVTFRKVPASKPPMVEVECLDLGSVHLHGLELMGADKKTVANRILLTAGKQTIERENLPYLGRHVGMEPYIIRQLIPKRKEPVLLIIPVQNIGS